MHKRFLKWLTGCSDSRVLKAYINITKHNKIHTSKYKWMERFIFFGICLLYPVNSRIKICKGKIVKHLLIGANENEEVKKIYCSFIQENIGGHVENCYWKDKNCLNDMADVLLYVKIWMRLVIVGIFGLFLSSDFRLIPLYKFYIYVLKVRLCRPESVFIFDYSQVENYLLSLVLIKYTKVTYIPSNSCLYEYMRYGYYENIDIIMSLPQIEEYKSYIGIGWLKVNNVTIKKTKPLFNCYIKKFDRIQLYDLAFYGSGEWARYNGMFRLNKLDDIIANSRIGNVYSDLNDVLISFLFAYANKNSVSFKVYLHPYEKELIKKYNLYPPILSKLKSNNFYVSDDYDSPMSNLYEAKIGVVTTSSVLYDRYQCGLEAYYYSALNQNSAYSHEWFYDPRYLPLYKDYAFTNTNELKLLLDKYFGVF
jgi:hypothetical protein